MRIHIHGVEILDPNTPYDLSEGNILRTGPANSNGTVTDGMYNGNYPVNISLVLPRSSGGGKKPTKKRVVVKGKPKVVYKGPRGGEYIKQNGGFVSLKTL